MAASYAPLSVLLLSLSPPLGTSLSQASAGPDPLGPPAVAAAGPVLQDRPFVVVWNMPTERCQKLYNIHLDLGDFDIMENRQQKFQGEKMVIFYRDRLGRYPYLSRGGRQVNGGIPQRADLAAHLSLAAAQTSGLLRPNFTGLAVIDWEEWRPLWEGNVGSKMLYRRLSELLVRQERPDLPDEAVASAARRGFEEAARRLMEETLRSALTARPGGLWGFYGFPYCFNKHKRKADQRYTGRCHRGTRRRNERLAWLWRRSAALYPSIYLPQRLAGSADAALLVRHRVLEALRAAARRATPVLSYARLAFTRTLTFINETDLVHTLGESAALGAAGAVLWGELKFAKSKRQCLLLRDYVRGVLGPFVRSLTSDARLCSLQLCRGNGRCARRRPGSGRMIPSGREVNATEAFLSHFSCQCYAGWTGRECREKLDRRTVHQDSGRGRPRAFV